MGALRVGIAQVDYTPKLGLPLLGNFRDDYAARGVHDPLCARAIVFANSADEKAALVMIDSCMVNRENVAFMRERMNRETGISGSRILIAATHTHSAPSLAVSGSLPICEKGDIEAILTKISSVVGLAIQRMEENELAVGCSEESRISFNRGLICKDGKTHMNWEHLDPIFVIKPRGPIDPQVMAVSIRRDEKDRAVLVNFPLHPAILAGDNWLYSADFPGYLVEAMRRVKGPDFATLFFNGCAGNINHVDYSDLLQGRGFQMAQRVGFMLGAAVQEAMNQSALVHGDEIRVSSERVPLQRLKVSEEQRRWSEEVLDNAKTQAAQGQVDGLPDLFYATCLKEMHARQDTDDRAEVMVVRVGDLGVVGLPGEIFCEFGMEIKKRSPARFTMVIELANDAIEYIPTRESFDQGGYESTPGCTLFERNAGERLTASALKQLNTLFH